MTPTLTYRTIDKTAWARGPWDQEPDKKQWQDLATGLPCLAVRTRDMGFWCGYVGVPPGHPAHGVKYDELDVDVHGGPTFSEACMEGNQERSICHIPGPGDPDHVWWIGFDTGHAWDLLPGKDSMLKGCGIESYHDPLEEYRTLAYVESQCAELARQLAALTPPLPAPSLSSPIATR